MSASVPKRPQYAQLSRLMTGNAVYGTHGQHWYNELAFLLAQNLQPVFANTFGLTGQNNIVVPYTRSPGAQVVLVEFELAKAAAGDEGASVSVAITPGSGSVSFLAVGSNPFDGSSENLNDARTLWNYQTFRGFMDVTSLTAGSNTFLLFQATQVGKNSKKFYRIQLTEVPLSETAAGALPSTEVAFEPRWCQAGNAIVDGLTSSAYGTVRMYDQLDQARTAPLQLFSIATEENALVSTWAITSTTFVALPFGTGSDPQWRFRVPAIYTGAIGANVTFAVRYYNPTVAATVRAVVTPVGGSPQNFDISLPTIGGAGWLEATSTITLPANGTSQEVTITFQAKVASAGTSYVSHISMLDTET